MDERAVEVSYLADMLDVPLMDYAFSGCWVGYSFGATADIASTPRRRGLLNHSRIRSQITRAAIGEYLMRCNSSGLVKLTSPSIPILSGLGDSHDAAFARAVSSSIAASVEVS